MKTTYFLRLKAGGAEVECPADKVAEYFEFIEHLTGLDRAMAGMILRSGQTIDHPIYTFRSTHVTEGVKA